MSANHYSPPNVFVTGQEYVTPNNLPEFINHKRVDHCSESSPELKGHSQIFIQ